MRACSTLIIALVAGCSFSGLPDELQPGDDVAMPDAAPNAPDGTDAADADADGIADSSDNCPLAANSDQANEDGDPQGDACDLCPQLAGPHADGDTDGVGDECDPNPSTPGDELVLFDGFNGTALGPAWSTVVAGGDGVWAVGGGVLTATVGEPAGIILIPVGAPGDTLRLETAADVTAVGPGATRSIALLADASNVPLAFDFCAVSFDGAEAELYRYEDATWSSVEAMPMSTPLGLYELRSRTMSGIACEVNDMALTASAATGTGDHAGFRVRNASVRYAYLAIYRSP